MDRISNNVIDNQYLEEILLVHDHFKTTSEKLIDKLKLADWKPKKKSIVSYNG